MNDVNTEQVEALRTLLASSGWLERTRYFARALRGRSRTPNGLLVVGTPTFEPWHMAAHLDDESRYSGLPELAPTLVRWAPPSDGPPHLRIGIDRIAQAGRSETLLVVGSDAAPDALLERVSDARRAGASILALDRGDDELDSLAHECLAVRPVVDPVSFDGAQHLVSMAVGEADLERSRYAADASESAAGGSRPARLADVRSRLARLLNAVSGTPDS
ncbi:MAG: hypothetical protein ACTHJW_22935 [Streptosporangiaceae bacterium]